MLGVCDAKGSELIATSKIQCALARRRTNTWTCWALTKELGERTNESDKQNYTVHIKHQLIVQCNTVLTKFRGR